MRGAATGQKSYTTLFKAVKNNNVSLVQHYCRLGFLTTFTIRGNLDKEYGFAPTVGFFENPTLLSVAANSVSGKKGEAIITALLKNGANAAQHSKYQRFSASSDGYGLVPPVNIESTETPAQSARDEAVRTTLLLAQFETALKEDKSIDVIVDILKNDYDHDKNRVKDYMVGLMKSDKSFKGVQHEITEEQLKKLKAAPEFSEWYTEITRPSKCCVM